MDRYKEIDHVQRLADKYPELLGVYKGRLDCGYKEIALYLLSQLRNKKGL